MNSFVRRRAQRVLGVAGLAAATLLAFGSFAQAQPEAAAVIKACVNKKTGDVRIPELPRGGGNGCTKQEQALTWNVKGPKGDRGTPGPQGPKGPAGPAGPATPPAGFSDVERDGTLSADDTTVLSLTNLPAGTYQVTTTLSAARIGQSPQFQCLLAFKATADGPAQAAGTMAEADPRAGVDGASFASSGAVAAQVNLGAGGEVVLLCRGSGGFTAAMNAVAVTAQPAAAP
ncbi:collagen-like protein [Catellatospora sichuanensis]|uniref:collagen-like protein n=1 Tax=Catellatospora sichuanensis TaxID=1969805 RepID=UPI00118248E4|nr:collagen-like protein [Catellatospora sichuanensis]